MTLPSMLQRVRGWGNHRSGIAFTALVVAAWVGCAQPSDESGTRTIILELRPSFELADSQGVLAPVPVLVRAVDGTGAPVPDIEITWQASGGGRLGSTYSPGPHEPDLVETAVTITDREGHANRWWYLGASPGRYELRLTAPDAEPLVLHVDALPGVVLIGLWTLAPERMAQLPSDTMRVHASNYLYHLRQGLERYERGESLRITGVVRRGSGIDDNWIFRIDPVEAALTPAAGVGGHCISDPPLTHAELDAALDFSLPRYRLCPWVLRLVRVEPVPDGYRP